MSHPEEIIADNQLQQQQQQQPQQHQQHPPPHPQHPPHPHHQIQVQQPAQPPGEAPTSTRKLRRACVACHAGKTRCSETLPCQNCLKRGLGNVCAYPDPDTEQQHDRAAAPDATTAATSATFTHAPPPVYAAAPQTGMTPLNHQQYYDYNGTFTGASSSTFRPAKRPRILTEEETAAITRNFSRGDFFVGNSAPVRIDPRLPVRLTLGEGDHVHFNVGNYESVP